MGYINQLSQTLPTYKNDVGEDLYLEDVAEEEISAWTGKKETDFGMGSFLQKYWDVTSKPEYGSDPQVPWSAAFISWILHPYGFKGSAGHSYYTDFVISGETKGWKAFSLLNSDKVRLNIGDVLIYDREPYDAASRASHGDVVYKIKDGYAYLVGGNLSNSLGIIKIPVDKDGFIKDLKSYQVILKNLKAAKVWKKFLYGTFIVGWYGFLIYNLRIKK